MGDKFFNLLFIHILVFFLSFKTLKRTSSKRYEANFFTHLVDENEWKSVWPGSIRKDSSNPN